MRKLVYYVGVTADGFIADPSGDASCFPQEPETLARLFAEYPETCPAHVRPILGIDAPARHFDTVLMGARTHQPALDAGLTSAYPHLAQYVVTHRTDLPADPSVTVVEDPVAVVRRLKAEPGADLWLCGGGDLAGQLLDEIDEWHLKVYPVLLGQGVALHGRAGQVDLSLVDDVDLGGGARLTRYRRA